MLLHPSRKKNETLLDLLSACMKAVAHQVFFTCDKSMSDQAPKALSGIWLQIPVSDAEGAQVRHGLQGLAAKCASAFPARRSHAFAGLVPGNRLTDTAFLTSSALLLEIGDLSFGSYCDEAFHSRTGQPPLIKPNTCCKLPGLAITANACTMAGCLGKRALPHSKAPDTDDLG